MTPWPPPKISEPQRLNVDISRADINTLKSVIPNHGFLSVLTQTFFHDLAEHIRSNGYTYVDYDTVLAYIRYRADSCFTQHPYSRIDRGGSEELHSDAKKSSHVKSGSKQTTKDRLGDKTGRKAKG